MLRPLLIRLSQQRRLQTFAAHNGLARRMARRFVAGETLDEAIRVVREINRRGMSATLDHLGENTTSPVEAEHAAETYRTLLRRIAKEGVDCNVSLKLTALGLDLGVESACAHLTSVVEEAAQLGNFIRIDMESSEYVDRTLDIFFRVFQEHKNVGVVIQSYLYRAQSDLERIVEAGARVRLVKGAYLEPPALAFQAKVDVDQNYVHLMKILLARGAYPAIATHDQRMIDATKRFASDQGIGPDRFEFQMLYGIRRDLQRRLVDEGYIMRVYVPYGTEWYPYLMRRMAERPANLMFVLGNIAREGRGRRQ